MGYGLRKAMMMTESGRLVSGPVATQPGDVVQVIAGARVPFICRRSEDSKEYRLVGECFVHGLTNREITANRSLVFDDMELI